MIVELQSGSKPREVAVSERLPAGTGKSVHGLLRARFDRIERTRIERGYPQVVLVRKAGVGRQTYLDALAGKKTPRATTLKKLEAALSKLRGEKQPTVSHQALIQAVYGVFVLALATQARIDPLAVHAQNPRRRATKNIEWLRIAQIRHAAIYLTNKIAGVDQSRIAAALNLTPAAISLAMRCVEDRCVDPTVNDTLERIGNGVAGVFHCHIFPSTVH